MIEWRPATKASTRGGPGCELSCSNQSGDIFACNGAIRGAPNTPNLVRHLSASTRVQHTAGRIARGRFRSEIFGESGIGGTLHAPSNAAFDRRVFYS